MPLNFDGKHKSAQAKANKKPKSEVPSASLKEEQKLPKKAEPPAAAPAEKKPPANLPPSKPDLHGKKQLNDEHEMQVLIEQSDEFKMWKNIPKAQRDRLTKK